MQPLTKSGRNLVVTLVAGAVLVAGYFIADHKGLIPKGVSVGAILAKHVDLPKAAPLSNVTNVPMLPLPSNDVIGGSADNEVRVDEAGWAAQFGFNYANGGPVTTKGSINEKNGVTNLHILRQDNFDQQVNDLIAFGAEFKKAGGNPKKGVQAISLMLDGAPHYFVALKNGLDVYNLHAKMVGVFGTSLGEDGFWGPAAWLKDPKKMKGAIVIGVLYDGDMNDAITFAENNDVRVNPDTKTYDPDALNIINADDYLKAVDMLRDGITETRTNTRTGKPIEITTDPKKGKIVGGPTVLEVGVVTWTPGDVRIATEVGGLVPLFTTAENNGQMPEAFIVIDEWAAKNPTLVKNIIKGGLEGGVQVKVHDKALYKAAEISVKAWTTKASPAYEKEAKNWYMNFARHKMTDKLGKEVMVGGSSAFSIEDISAVVGLEKGDGGSAKSTYTTYGDEIARLWPKYMAGYPAFDEIFNPAYIQMAAKELTSNMALSQKTEYAGKVVGETVASTTQHIQFDSGKASLTTEGKKQMNIIYNKMNINALHATFTGKADKHGDPAKNLALSKARAQSAVDYLVGKGLDPDKFTANGVGDTQATGNDAADRAVVIELSK